MKLKENKGMSLIVFTIILLVLAILGGTTVYLLKKQDAEFQYASKNDVVNNIKNEVYTNTNQVAERNDVVDNNENEENQNKDEIIKKEKLCEYGDIILEAAYVNEEEYLLIYTRKNKNNKIEWEYKTGTERVAENSHIGTSEITEDRIYIEDHGTITVLNRNTGKTLWKWKYAENDTVTKKAEINYVDKQNYTYITYGKTLTILDKNGKVKLNKTYNNLNLTDSHCSFTYINKTEGIVLGNDEFVIVSLKDYSTKISGTYHGKWYDDNQTVEITYLNVITDDNYNQGVLLRGYKEGKEMWSHITDIKPVGQYDNFQILEITNDRIYFNEEGNIVVLNNENGEVIWKNTDANSSIIGSYYLDKEQNLYISYGEKVSVINKDGKTKAVIKHEYLVGLIGEGPTFNFINENELLLEGAKGNVTVNLKDYSIKEAIKRTD